MQPTLSYIICASQRSGSNFLCDLLRYAGGAGKPHEFFRDWHLSSLAGQKTLDSEVTLPSETIKKQLAGILEQGSTPNGVFGIKIMGNQTNVIKKNISTLPGIGPRPLSEAFDSVFPNLNYIHLTRNDKISQAVSFAKAIQSDLWIQFKPSFIENKPRNWTEEHYLHFLRRNERGTQRPLTYDREQIAWCRKDIEQQDAFWENFFRESGIKPLRLLYEQLEQFPDTELARVMEFLGLPSATHSVSARVPMLCQRDELSTEWIRRFSMDMADHE